MKTPLLALCCFMLLFFSCKEEAITITLSPTTLEMTVGEIKNLTITGITSGDINWTSSDESIATVFYGAVTALTPGIVTITATYKEASAQCIIIVTSSSSEGNLLITPTILSLEKGDTYQLQCKNTYNLPLTWISSNDSVVSVDEHGLVTALSAGYSIITASNGSESTSATVAVSHTWGEYELVWSEEFNDESLDTDVWNYEIGGGGFGNNEQQYYTDRSENIRCENGCLIIEARKETYENREYTSARINTKGKKEFAYGKIEARISLPSGQGTWPAFWMLGQNYSTTGWPKCGELDIMEHIGSQPTMVSFAVHTKEKNGTKGNNWSSRTYIDGIEDEFHIYGIEWIKEDYYGRDKIIFTVDNTEYASTVESVPMDDANTWPFNQGFFIILNLAIGGNMGGTIDDSIFQNEILMKVDWIRVYQRHEIE